MPARGIRSSAQRRDVALAEPHRARFGPVEAADEIEHRGLAGAVRADDAGDRAGLRVEAEDRCTARTPPKLTDRPRPKAASGGAAARKRLMSRSLLRRCVAALRRAASARSAPTKPSGARQQHHEQQQRRRTAAGIAPRTTAAPAAARRRSAPTSGPSTRSAPPIITTSRNRIDWKNGKRFRADEIADRGEDAAGKPGEHGRDARTPSVRIERRIEADRLAGDFGIAHRAHGVAPGLALSSA